MSTLADLRPGDIGFATISGGAGALVWLGQKLLAATSWDERHLRHVFVVTEGARQRDFPFIHRDPDGFTYEGMHSNLQRPRIVQAMPSGAEEIEIGPEHWTKNFVYLRPQYEDDEGWHVASCAQRYIGTPYSFADYAAILGLHMGVKNGLVRRRVTSSGHMICSQLADQALSDAGYHVFDDGRLPQDVMPVELYRALAAMPGTQIIRPI